MNILILAITILVTTVDAFLANYIFYEDRASKIHRLAAARSLDLSVYAFCTFMFFNAGSLVSARFWGNASTIPYLMLGAIAFQFAWFWTRHDSWRYTRWLTGAIYAITFLVILANLSLAKNEPARSPWALWSLISTSHSALLYLLNFWPILLQLSTLILASLYFAQMKAPGDRKRQTFIFLGVIFPSTFGYLFNFLVQFFNPQLSALLPFWILVGDILIIYGIQRNRAFLVTPLLASHEVVEAMTDALLLVDVHGKVLLANPAMSQLTGYTEEELVNKNIAQIFPPEAFSAETDLPTAASQRLIRSIEKTILTHDGGQAHVLFSASRLHDRRGDFYGTVVVLTDITARRQSEASLQQTLSLLSATIESMPNAILVVDRQDQIIACNDKFLSLWHLPDFWVRVRSPAERHTMLASRSRHPESFLALIDQPINEMESVSSDLIETLEGRIIERTTHPYRVNGEVMGKVYTYQDITTQKRLEAEEHAAHAITEVLGTTGTAMSSSLDIDQVLNTILIQIGRVIPYDAINILIIENGVATSIRSVGFDLFDHEAAQALSSTQFKIAISPNLKWMLETHQSLVIPDIHHYPGWIENAVTHYFHSWAGAPLLAHGQVVAFFSLFKVEADFYSADHARYLDIFASQAALAMENARLFAEVKELAITDPLTGLYNRRHFLELAETAFSNALRYERPLSVIMVDIDEFKKINDTHGHFVGDYFLKNIGTIFLSRLRQADIKGRFGGEEFLFVLPETRLKSALLLAESLRSRIANLHLKTDHGRICVTASFGLVALDSSLDSSLETLLIRADQAMYQAKEAGGNCIHAWQSAPPVID